MWSGDSRKNSNAHLRPAVSESGQATVEYIIILAMTVLVAAGISKAVLKGVDKGVLSLGSQLELGLKTGRAPTSVWSN